jgi:hypothetical protein
MTPSDTGRGLDYRAVGSSCLGQFGGHRLAEVDARTSVNQGKAPGLCNAFPEQFVNEPPAPHDAGIHLAERETDLQLEGIALGLVEAGEDLEHFLGEGAGTLAVVKSWRGEAAGGEIGIADCLDLLDAMPFGGLVDGIDQFIQQADRLCRRGLFDDRILRRSFSY